MSGPSQVSIFPATSASASRLAELLQQQHPDIRVRLAARSPAKLQAGGGNVSVAQTSLDIANLASIKDALNGSDAAYIMNPPFYGERDPFALSKTFIDNIIEAANASSALKRLVFLSSVGAEKSSGTGPIYNVHVAETALLADLRDGVEAITLRPPYFLSNFKAVLPLAVNPPHILPSMILPFEKAFPMIDAHAIAEKALKYLVAPPSSSPHAASKGHITTVELVTTPKTVPQIAQLISDIAGVKVNPVPVHEQDWLPTFKKAGMFDEQAGWFADMQKGMNTGYIAFLDQPAIQQEHERGVTIVKDATDVDYRAALKRLVNQVKSA